MPNPTVYAGATDSESLVVTWVRRDPTFDTQDVNGGHLIVKDRVTTRTWPFSVLSRTPGQVVFEHVFAADGSDVPVKKTVRCQIIVQTSGGRVRRGVPFNLDIVE